MNVFKRFLGSCIDKVLILLIVGIFVWLFCPYEGPTYLGTFLGAILNESIASYSSMEPFMKSAHSLSEIDHTVAYSFLLLNVVYYFLCEMLLKASLGKYIMGGRCTDSSDEEIGFGQAFKRALIFGMFILFAILFRESSGHISYSMIIILFFMALDIPVLFCKRSTLDIVTGTYYK